ncbi:MAG: hypothetical protein AB1589_13090 [Cyanobacteriota bacterium]
MREPNPIDDESGAVRSPLAKRCCLLAIAFPWNPLRRSPIIPDME